MTLPKVQDLFLAGKNVLVRADLEGGADSPRMQATNDMVNYLMSHDAKQIRVIGHGGKNYANLRDDLREEANNVSLAAELADGFDVYVNEAFATSHRKHCSIDALPRLMKNQGKQVGVGLRFSKELEMLSKVTMGLLVVGGTKVQDKNRYADELEKRGWKVLRGGLLAGTELRPDGLDISDASISNFKFQISNSQSIVAAGVMGKYEDANSEKGTKEILTAIANSKAYKVAGGGDIEAAISKYGLSDKFDWISVGGGAMLEYLSTGTLPGIEALITHP